MKQSRISLLVLLLSALSIVSGVHGMDSDFSDEAALYSPQTSPKMRRNAYELYEDVALEKKASVVRRALYETREPSACEKYCDPIRMGSLVTVSGLAAVFGYILYYGAQQFQN